MGKKKIKIFYRCHLPHLQPLGGAFFVTFRLQGSIPLPALQQLRQRYEYEIIKLTLKQTKTSKIKIQRLKEAFFYDYDQLLDKTREGPHYLAREEIATIVQKELHRFDGKWYELIAYSILSNHVHILIDTSIQIPEDPVEKENWMALQQIMKRIKGPSAIYANRFLNRSGKFWQRESYDRYIRSEKELNRTIAYILENPVKAGIVKEWTTHPFTYYCNG